MREDARQRAAEFVKELYAAGAIDADRLDTSAGEVLAARSEIELAGVIRSLPAPVTLTSQERRLARPLEIHSGIGRLRLTGKWQLARRRTSARTSAASAWTSLRPSSTITSSTCTFIQGAAASPSSCPRAWAYR